MSTVVRTSGYANAEAGISSSRLAFTLSNGNALVLVKDPNNSTASNGEKNNTQKLYVYESVDRSTWTLRATITPPFGAGRLGAALFPDNSLGIYATDSTVQNPRYCKMTYSTYAVSAWETVGNTTFTNNRLDLVITDTNVPILVTSLWDSGGTLRTSFFVRRASDNSWIQTSYIMIDNLSSGSYPSSIGAISIAATGGSATARALVVAHSGGDPVKNTKNGVQVRTYVVNETTGAFASGSDTLRTSVAAGEANSNTGKAVAREVRLFKTGTNEFTLAIAHSEINKTRVVYRGTWDGTTYKTVVPAATSGSSGYSIANIQQRGLAISYANDTLNFIYCVDNVGDKVRIFTLNYNARINRDTNSVSFGGSNWWTNGAPSGADQYLAWAGGDRNLTLTNSYHDSIILHNYSDTNQNWRHEYAYVPRAPIQKTPASGAVYTDSNPPLAADADLDREFAQSAVKMRWQIAKDTTFTTNLQDYTEADSFYKTVNGTNVAGVTVRFNDALPVGLYALSQGTWYVRSAMVDRFDNTGPFNALATFKVSHPPAASELSPSGATQFKYGTGSRQFTWKFSDPSKTDTQTAYQVVVERNDTGASVYDSGKITSTSKAHSATMPTTVKDVLLQWKVRLWDSDDVAGSYSDYALFRLADPPTVAISAPTNGQIVTSGVPSVTFTPSVGGIRTITSYVVNITQAGAVVWTSGTKTVNVASGTAITSKATRSYLKNNQAYSISITVTDSTGLSATSSAWGFTTSWVTPAAPSGLTVSTSDYNVDGRGYVAVSWADTGRDADFSSWVIYRKDDEIDPATNTVLEEGVWTEIARNYDQVTTGYTHLDYLAPAGHRSNYRVTQEVNRFGDAVESSNTNAVLAYPVSDGYWLIEVETASAYRLANVTGDSYTDEYESSEYTVLGRGRHVDTGEHLGWKGQLDAQLRDSTLMSARQKKRNLERIKETALIVHLRNPFGDTFRVSVGDIGVARLAGVGTSEFVDVTVPYSQVSE